MNKLKKIGLTALGTALVSTSVSAVEMGVSGSASITLIGKEKADAGNSWSMGDTLTFSASGDMDNGWSVSYMQDLNAGTQDNSSIALGMGDMGTLTFVGTGGSGVTQSWDDVMPYANEEVLGVGFAVTPTAAATGASGSNMFKYSNEIMDGATVHVGYVPGAAGAKEGSVDYGIQYTGVEGLDIGFATGDNNGTASNEIEGTSMYAKYAIDAFTIGIQNNETDQQTAAADTDTRIYAVSYAVSEDLSVSYAQSNTEYENSSLTDQSANNFGISFTNGGLSVTASYHEVENSAGASAAANDLSAYEINFGFAF